MCGIAGIISSQNRENEIYLMLEAQKHRGPDHTGVYADEGFAVLGHNRLSIIDLSEAANQPFSDPSGRYQLLFNGEIYNYKELRNELASFYTFKTSSDTEVLLAAYLKYGEACLDKFNGMFSFAIWDQKEKVLFAARDRFGVKPFHYSQKKGEFYFASEIKSLNQVLGKVEPDKKVWANYFAYGSYGLPDETFYKDISQLPGGHLLTYKKGKLQVRKWYDFAPRVQQVNVSGDLEQTKKEYLELLKDSISLRFRADVEAGFNLSGGVDSSLLLALVNQYDRTEKIKAYSFYTGDDRYDELPWVEQMIAKTGNPLTKVRLDAAEVKELAEKINRFQDEPYGGIPTLAYARIFEQARKDRVLVLLDGQGMDEQWAGYDYYGRDTTALIQGQSGSPFRPECIDEELLKFAEKPKYPEVFENKLQNQQYRDLFYTKIPRALRFNDRVSMGFSTELREPFLDYRLVEFAFAQPEDFKIRGNVHKFLLRELVKDLVPEEISYAPKRPLQTPQREWLAEDLKEWVEERMESLANSPYSDWFDLPEIRTEWKNYLSGDRQSSFHIWQWVNFSLLMDS